MRCSALIALCVILLTSCANVGNESVYTPHDLNRNASAYAGRTVTVRGYVLLGTNSRVLYQSRDDYERAEISRVSPPENCLTILNNDELLWSNRAVLHRQTITVTGTFLLRDAGTLDLQACLQPGGAVVPTGILIDEGSLRSAVDRQISRQRR